MTTSTEADSDTTPGTDLDAEAAADQSPTDDAGASPGADAGVGTRGGTGVIRWGLVGGSLCVEVGAGGGVRIGFSAGSHDDTPYRLSMHR